MPPVDQQDARQSESQAKTCSFSRTTFVQHLEHATSVVSRWPAWKQQLLGGEVSSDISEETAIAPVGEEI